MWHLTKKIREVNSEIEGVLHRTGRLLHGGGGLYNLHELHKIQSTVDTQKVLIMGVLWRQCMYTNKLAHRWVIIALLAASETAGNVQQGSLTACQVHTEMLTVCVAVPQSTRHNKSQNRNCPQEKTEPHSLGAIRKENTPDCCNLLSRQALNMQFLDQNYCNHWTKLEA